MAHGARTRRLPLLVALAAAPALPACGGGGCAGGDPTAPGCAALETPAPPQSVVFQSNRHGPTEIYTMNANGTEVTRLTLNPGIDGGARWSPDGTRIAFSSLRAGAREIWVMNADGSDQRQLTSLGLAANIPDWSPDGSRIAFHVAGPGGSFAIYVMNSDGSELRRLDSPHTQLRPRWSRDGSRLLINWFEDTPPCGCVGALPHCPCDGRLALIDPDGGSLELLPRIGLDDSWGEWSPDGRHIVFASYRSTGTGLPARAQVTIMNADGTAPRSLTGGVLDEWSPSWSAATGRIFFVRSFDIYSLRPDGSDLRRVSAHQASDVLVHSR
jgi:Tol biopolymer transport system component